MGYRTVILVTVLIVFCCAGWGRAQQPIVFPADGQSEEQMQQDKFTCHNWAKEQTGFDPMQGPEASAAEPEERAGTGKAVKGGAVGAGAGALLSRGSRVKGALGGALAGGVLGGAMEAGERRQDEKARQELAQEQQQEQEAAREEYNRAFSACMESKGYTVR